MVNRKAQHLLERIHSKKLLFKIVSQDTYLNTSNVGILSSIYNRKDRSLEELSRKFLSHVIQYDSKIIYLDYLTHQLDVERRRLYDIINILESLRVVTRQRKNQYCWNGFKTIYQTIIDLKHESNEAEVKSQNQTRKQKSLEVLSVGFLKLFNMKSTWTLEEAATKLSPVDTGEDKLKTRTRRLYDIANVFKSIGLISKSQSIQKAGYKWIGESGLDLFHQEMKKHLPQVNDKSYGIKKQKIDQPIVIPQIDIQGLFNHVMNLALLQKFPSAGTEKKQSPVRDLDRSENYNPLTVITPKIRPTLTIIYPPSQDQTVRKTLTLDEIQEFRSL